ncbi:MarR family transcriptional regulator [Actinomycetospora sp. CA-084318]|uniref:MarR family transcriptional regulator n=1 Tax=Actinomycetospora sp. CA-084318 TaxID=3239892 RepID=UPI003D975DBC
MTGDVVGGSLALSLHRALARVTARIEAATAPEGVLLPQWLVLACLAESGDLAMGELVEGTGLNDSTLTRVVDRLATSGLVYRAVDPADRRRVRVSLGDRGRALHARLAPAVRTAEDAEREPADGVTSRL